MLPYHSYFYEKQFRGSEGFKVLIIHVNWEEKGKSSLSVSHAIRRQINSGNQLQRYLETVIWYYSVSILMRCLYSLVTYCTIWGPEGKASCLLMIRHYTGLQKGGGRRMCAHTLLSTTPFWSFKTAASWSLSLCPHPNILLCCLNRKEQLQTCNLLEFCRKCMLLGKQP